jgi:hypothetical protein
LRCDRKAERESKTNKRIERRKRMNGISYQINEDGVELITTWMETCNIPSQSSILPCGVTCSSDIVDVD